MSEWIDTKDSMPGVGVEVLGVVANDFSGRQILRVVSHVDEEDCDWRADGAEVSYWWTVTHWMPLPKPPEAT